MKRYLFTALAIAAVVGCQKEDSDTSTSNNAKAISFSSAIETRTTDTEWESDDVVGVMITKDNAYFDSYKYNAKHNVDISTSSTLCSFNPESLEHTLYWPSDSTMTIDFYSYYPYNELLVEEQESYPVDVTDQSTPKAIDFMEASTRSSHPEGYCSSDNVSVSLSFKRRMSKLSFEVVAGDGLELEDITAVTLKGFYNKADYDFVNNEFINLLGNDPITAYSSGNVYSAIVIPTMDSDEVYAPTNHTIVFTTTKGDFEWDITNVDLNAGAHRYYTVTISSTVVVSGGNEINVWDTQYGGELEVE